MRGRILIMKQTKDKSTLHLEVLLCPKEHSHIIENLLQFYFYDMQRGSKFAHYPLHSNGQFENLPYFKNYWEEENAFPYLIRKNNQSIGFALVHDHTLSKANFKMAEFFILDTYRMQGIGQYVVTEIMKQHRGVWEVSVYKDNELANVFWRKVLPNHQIRHYPEYPNFLVYEVNSNQMS